MCYVFWGIYHGILIILGALFELPIQKLTKVLHINTECFSFNLFRMARTFFLSAIGRIFFVSTAGFTHALLIIKRTFDFRNFGLHTMWDESLYSFGLDRHVFTLSLLLIGLVWAVSMLQEKFAVEGKDVYKRQVYNWNR